MSRQIANVNLLTDTFYNMLEGTNFLLTALSSEIITANVTYANTGNTSAPRHSQLFGSFTANTIIVSGDLRGGNVSTSANLTVSSNVGFTGNTITVYSNPYFTNATYFTSNVYANGPTISITSNTDITNSNTTITSPKIVLAGPSGNAINVAGNTTSVNTTISGNNLIVTSPAQFTSTLTGIFINVGEFAVNNTTIRVGNSTVNTTITSSLIGGNPNTQFNIANTSSVKVANTITVGANVTIGTNLINLGNNTVNVSISTSGIMINGANVLSVGQDGAGSGLDADLLDGEQGAYYRNADNINAGTLNAARLPTAFSNTNIAGYANVSTTLAVTGATTLGNTVSVAGPLTVMSDYVMEVAGNTNLGNTQFARVIYSFPKATYRSAKVMVLASNSGNNQMSEMVLAHDNATPYITVYGVVASPPSGNTSSPLGTYQVQINNANVELLLAQTRANTAVKVVSHLIK